MTVPPVSLAQVKELISLPDDTLCAAIVKTFVRLPLLVYKFVKWAIKSDGTFTQDFRNWICEGCEANEEEEEEDETTTAVTE